jgi:hypothetical protein
MTDFLKGNYSLPGSAEGSKRGSDEDEGDEESLTVQMEEAALAKLGGSICFVVKDKTLLWMGDSSEETG